MTPRCSIAVELRGGNKLSVSHFYFHKAANVLGLSDKIRTILLTPHRTVKEGIAIEQAVAAMATHIACLEDLPSFEKDIFYIKLLSTFPTGLSNKRFRLCFASLEHQNYCIDNPRPPDEVKRRPSPFQCDCCVTCITARQRSPQMSILFFCETTAGIGT